MVSISELGQAFVFSLSLRVYLYVLTVKIISKYFFSCLVHIVQALGIESCGRMSKQYLFITP